MWIFVKIQTIEASQKIWAHNSHFRIFFEYLRIHICLDSCVPPYFNRLSLFLVHVIGKCSQSYELNEFIFFQIRFAKIYFHQQKRSNSKFTFPFPLLEPDWRTLVLFQSTYNMYLLQCGGLSYSFGLFFPLNKFWVKGK